MTYTKAMIIEGFIFEFCGSRYKITYNYPDLDNEHCRIIYLTSSGSTNYRISSVVDNLNAGNWKSLQPKSKILTKLLNKNYNNSR